MREVTVTTVDGHRIVFGQDNPMRKILNCAMSFIC